MNNTVDFIELDAPIAQSGEPGPALISGDLGLVGHVHVQLVIEVGRAEMTLDELFALKNGDVVTLNEQVNEPVLLRLDGKPVARGNLLAVGDNFGIQVTEIL